MIFLHETHEISGGKKEEFLELMRSEWKPLIERDRLARLMWFFVVPHGTSVSYQAVSITAVKDWQSWGVLAGRSLRERAWKKFNRDICKYRRDMTARLLVPNPKSPIQEVDLDFKEDPPGEGLPGIYLHDTGWPFPGKMEGYVDALHSVLGEQVAVIQPPVITVEAGWRNAPGAGRFHEAILLSKIHNWELFSFIITFGEPPPNPGDWMLEGLKYRDQWESKLLRTVSWSPMR
ncbi:MAG: hypothetical protein IBX68_07730 [Dehalococcoidia bacterium]|nr:hypothetical protein [Dehalococcoidia bacterium]